MTGGGASRSALLRWGTDEAYARLRGRLEALGDDEFAWRPVQDCGDGPRLTSWGERWPAWRIIGVMIDHDALHAGAIGALRDL